MTRQITYTVERVPASTHISIKVPTVDESHDMYIHLSIIKLKELRDVIIQALKEADE